MDPSVSDSTQATKGLTMTDTDSDRVAALEARVVALEDRLHTLVLCVQYQEDEPFDAEISRLMLHGEDRVVLNLVLRAILERASGKPLSPIPGRNVLSHPALERAYASGPISAAEAVHIVSMVVGGDLAAERVIKAHRDRGFGKTAYESLGISPS